jgi:hypothetical protein
MKLTLNPTLSLLFCGAIMAAVPAHAAISIATPAATYTQNFDTLTTATTAQPWANDSTLAGWSLFLASTGAPAPTLLGGTGSSNTGSFFSFGAAGTAERALGGVGSGGAYWGTPSPAQGAVAGYIAVAFSNDTGSALTGFTIGFDGEEWRDGGATVPVAQTMVLQYGFGSSFASVTSWTAPGGSFDWWSPVFVNTGSGAAVDGNGAGKVPGVGGIVTTPWAAGDTLWVRWIEKNDPGNDHGLAIDNLSFSVSAVPEPQTYALFIAGIAALTFVARRRRA